jgi:two-component system OmpR family response regulator
MKKDGKKILIIDDDNSHLLAARGILEQEGYRVMTHNQVFGSAAMATRLDPDLILLDINMPCLSGERVAQIIGGSIHSRNIPILFYSSNDEDSLKKSVGKYRYYGVKDYICKGDPYELRKKVASYLRNM